MFTVLRDPGERIASFYFFLQREAASLGAAALNLPHNIGLKRALNWAPDDYFFGGDDIWQTFLRSHYDNFYCTYFATRRMLGWRAIQSLPQDQLLAKARLGLGAVDQVFSTNDMAQIEASFQARFGVNPQLANRYDNTSDEPTTLLRWPRLLASFGSDAAADRMQSFAQLDRALTAGLL